MDTRIRISEEPRLDLVIGDDDFYLEEWDKTIAVVSVKDFINWITKYNSHGEMDDEDND